MNPLTNTRNIKALNENDIKNGIFDHRRTWHAQYKDSAYIFVGGIPFDLSEGDLICVFSQYGEIVNINLVRDKKTGKSQGYGFICYEDQRSTILAVDNLNSIKLGGRTIRVDHVANYRPPKSDEKDETGNYKIKEEKGCAPKTPSPEPDDRGTKKPKAHKKEKKRKKEKKEKKKKKKKTKRTDRDSNTESTDNEDLGKMVCKSENQGPKKKLDSLSDNGMEKKLAVNKYKDASSHRDQSKSGGRSGDASPPRKRNRTHRNETSSDESTDSKGNDNISKVRGKLVHKKDIERKKPDSQWDKVVKASSPPNKHNDALPSRRKSRSRSRSRDTSPPHRKKTQTRRSSSDSTDSDEGSKVTKGLGKLVYKK